MSAATRDIASTVTEIKTALDEKFPAELPMVRDVANDHAHECRAMPKEARPR